jgi:hypothetical protein
MDTIEVIRIKAQFFHVLGNVALGLAVIGAIAVAVQLYQLYVIHKHR